MNDTLVAPIVLKSHNLRCRLTHKFWKRNIKIFVEDRLSCLRFLLRSFSLFSKFEIYFCKIVSPYFYHYLFGNNFSLIYVLNDLNTLFILCSVSINNDIRMVGVNWFLSPVILFLSKSPQGIIVQRESN